MVSTRRSGSLSSNTTTTSAATPTNNSTSSTSNTTSAGTTTAATTVTTAAAAKRSFSSADDNPPSTKRLKAENGGSAENSKEMSVSPTVDPSPDVNGGGAAAVDAPVSTPITDVEKGLPRGVSISPLRNYKLQSLCFSSSTPWCRLLSQYTQNASITISSPEYTIGSSRQCNLVLKGQTLSGTLCKIRHTQRDGCIVAVLESTGSKGTVSVNGMSVKKNTTRLRWGVGTATTYIYSLKNLERGHEANELLFRQLQTYLDDDLDNIKRKGIKLWMIGEKSVLPEYLQNTIKNVEEVTKNNTKLELMFALCYGGTREIAQATRSLCKKVKEGVIDPEEIDEELMEKELWTGPSRAPNPDLLIRTGGRIRVSNYLIWQLNQTELYFCKTYAPDFKEADFIEALRSYQQRERTFGE